jgi:hypothetical protein
MACWRTDEALSCSADLRGSPGRFISPGVVVLSDDQLGYAKGLLARDPDGHALLFTDT